jgi:hypothetical protein
MKLQEIVEHIQSIEFQANFSVLSGFRSLVAAFAVDETLKALCTLLKGNLASQAIILQQIQKLLADYEEGHLHKHDIAVAAYLYVLEQVADLEALAQITKAVQSTDNFWWARKMADQISTEKLQNLPS